MKILVRKQFYYDIEHGRFACRVEFCLPADRRGHLAKMLRGVKSFIGERLSKDWGDGDGEWRIKGVELDDRVSWGRLVEVVDDYVEGRIEEIRDILEGNDRILRETPKESVLEIEI